MKQLFLICCLLYFLQGHSQSLTHFNYTIADGLPSTECYDIFQDDQGFMWFATDNGVVRFDGTEMKTFHLKDGLTDPVVFNFQPDDKGRIWFRTYSGRLSYFEDGVIKPYPYNDTLQKIGYRHIINFTYLSDKEELWFNLRNILGKIDSLGNVSLDTLDDPMYEHAVTYKTLGKKDILISSLRYAPINALIINDSIYPVQTKLSSFANRVYSKVYWNGKLFIAAFDDVFEFDGKTAKVVRNFEKPIISLSVDHENHLWVGFYKGGVKRFDKEDLTSEWEPEFLTDQSVTKVCQSSDSSYWFSTLEYGIFYLANVAIMNYHVPGKQQLQDVDTGGKYILVGNKDGELWLYDRKTLNIERSKSLGQSLLALSVTARDQIFTSTHNDITAFSETFSMNEHYPVKTANFFLEARDGTIWANSQWRISRFMGDGQLLREDTVYSLYRSILVHGSSIFMSERIGLDVRSMQLELIRRPDEFRNFKISKLLEINDSTILVATMGNGFHLLNTRTWKKTTYDLERNFIANNIHCLLKTDSSLWIGSDKGLAEVSISSLLNGKPLFNFIGRESGLVSNNIRFLARGHQSVWAFSTDAFSIIPDNFTRFANKKPSFYIKSVTVNGEPYSIGKLANLKPNQDNIGINFGYISFNNRNIFLRYKINEEAPWTNLSSGARSIQFSSLASGEYAFQLQYSADNINWFPSYSSFPFTIDRPWWGKWYFYVSLLFATMLLSYLYFRYQRAIYKQKHHYLRIINEHQQKLLHSEVETLERERNRIAKELHDRVGTNLTAIKLRVNQILRTNNNSEFTDVEDQFQVAIREIKEIIYDLTPPSLERYGLFTGLKNYVGKLDKRIPITISLKTFGSELYDYELNILIFRVLQELISNSIKHSFAKNITIHISAFDDLVNIVYEDDGVGFKYDPVKSGLGLNNIESRIQSVQGTLKFESGTYGVSYTIDIPLKTNTELKTKDLNHDSNRIG